MSKFDIYVKVSILINYKTKQPSNLAWDISLTSWLYDLGARVFVEIDHEIFSTVILSLPLIKEGQLSVSGERICTILVNRLED